MIECTHVQSLADYFSISTKEAASYLALNDYDYVKAKKVNTPTATYDRAEDTYGHVSSCVCVMLCCVCQALEDDLEWERDEKRSGRSATEIHPHAGPLITTDLPFVFGCRAAASHGVQQPGSAVLKKNA